MPPPEPTPCSSSWTFCGGERPSGVSRAVSPLLTRLLAVWVIIDLNSPVNRSASSNNLPEVRFVPEEPRLGVEQGAGSFPA